MKNRRIQLITGFTFLSSALLLNSCSLFLGNIRPIEEKSDTYSVLDLSKVSSDWGRLDPRLSNNSQNTPPQESAISDVVLQSQSTGSIVSINSACKSYQSSEKQTLQDLTRELFLGISDITLDEERNLTLQNTPALETTIRGKQNGEKMKIRAIVLVRANCVYDLMYISRAELFQNQEADFTRFVSSLRLK